MTTDYKWLLSTSSALWMPWSDVDSVLHAGKPLSSQRTVTSWSGSRGVSWQLNGPSGFGVMCAVPTLLLES